MIFQVTVSISHAHRDLRSGALKTRDVGMRAKFAVPVRPVANVKTDG